VLQTRKHNLAITLRHFRPTGLVKEAVAYGGRGGQHERTGPAGSDPRGDSNGNLIFEFHGPFAIWQDFEKFYKEI
jgi:hypothetical protein